MLVTDLIQELEKLPAHMEVLIDITKPDMKMFHFKQPNLVGLVEDAEGQEFVAIACVEDEEEVNYN